MFSEDDSEGQNVWESSRGRSSDGHRGHWTTEGGSGGVEVCVLQPGLAGQAVGLDAGGGGGGGSKGDLICAEPHPPINPSGIHLGTFGTSYTQLEFQALPGLPAEAAGKAHGKFSHLSPGAPAQKGRSTAAMLDGLWKVLRE